MRVMRRDGCLTKIGMLPLLLLLLLSACTVSDQASSEMEVGAILVLSGEAASWGQNSQRGIELAVSEVNAEGGINGRQVRVVYEDSGGIPARAVAAYRKLVDVNRVEAIIGPNFQSAVGALAPLIAEEGFPVVTPASAPVELRPNPRNPLVLWLDASVQSQRMANYVFEQGVRSVAVLGSEDSWEREVSLAFADEFERLGGMVTNREILSLDSGDPRTAATKIIENNPDAVYVGSYFYFLQATRAFKELGYSGALYSLEVDAYLAQESAGFASGLEFISPERYSEDFTQRFVALHGAVPQIPSGQSYDAANVLFAALRSADSSEELLQYFEEFSGFDGVAGEIVIDEVHRALTPTAIFRLEDGEIVRLFGTE